MKQRQRAKRRYSWRERVHRFRCAWAGCWRLFREELHARIHGAAALGALLLGVVCDIAAHEWLAIALSIALVLTAETFNAALEALADALHPGHHPGVGRAKDFAAGAVLWSALGALAVGIWIFGPHLWRLGQDIIW